MIKRLLLLITLLMPYARIEAQTASVSKTAAIKGFVYDKSTGEPMIYVPVLLKNTKFAVQTDVNGYYSINQIPEGNYVLISVQSGYDTAAYEVNLAANQLLNKKLFLHKADIQLKDVRVSARKIEKRTMIGAGVTTITPREMKLLPSAGGEPDLAQYLQVTPGITFTGDQGGQLYIRGGAPSQTGILLDGVTIYNPFHTIGLYSVFETDAIRSVDIQSAGFGAEYGNRTSAILDIHTKDGNKNRLSGKASISPIMGRIMLEGPLVKQKKEEGGATTFLISYKNSYLNNTSKSIYGGFGEPFSYGLPYSFSDLYAKVSFGGSNGSKLNVFGFNFIDKAQFFQPHSAIPLANFDWKANGAGATFVVSPASSSALISGKFAYSNYNINYDVTNQTERTSAITGFESAINFTNFFTGYSQLKYGLEVSGFHTALNYANEQQIATTLDRQNTLAALYVSYRKNFNKKFIFEPSIRLQYYSSIAKFSPEPRLGLKYNLSNTVRLKFATGLYSQNIISTKSDRDIVNFFTGFLLSPDQEIKNENGTAIKTNLLTAFHVLGGLEVEYKDIEFNLEPWMKDFTRTIELSRTKSLPTDPDYQAGRGFAYGLDLTAKYSKGRYFIWTAFSYQNVTNTFIVPSSAGLEKQTYATPFDRRFNMNLLGSYQMGAKKNIEFSLRYNYGSPFPFTQTQGFYENQTGSSNIHGNGSGTLPNIGGNNLQNNGQLGLLFADQINGGRLSSYHRIDVSLKKKFKISKTSNIETTLSITNVINRQNIFYVERITNTKVYQLPFFPSINVTWNF